MIFKLSVVLFALFAIAFAKGNDHHGQVYVSGSVDPSMLTYLKVWEVLSSKGDFAKRGDFAIIKHKAKTEERPDFAKFAFAKLKRGDDFALARTSDNEESPDFAKFAKRGDDFAFAVVKGKEQETPDFAKRDFAKKFDYGFNRRERDFAKRSRDFALVPDDDDFAKRDFAKRDFAKRDFAKRDFAKRDFAKRDFAKRSVRFGKRDFAKRFDFAVLDEDDFAKRSGDFALAKSGHGDFAKRDFAKKDFAKRDFA